MKLKRLLATAAMMSMFAVPAMAQEIKLNLHHFLSERAPAHSKMLVPWAERVEELSGGKVDIEIYPLCSSPNTLLSSIHVTNLLLITHPNTLAKIFTTAMGL